MRLNLLILAVCLAATGCAGGFSARPYGYAPVQYQQPVYGGYYGGYSQPSYQPYYGRPVYQGPAYSRPYGNYAPAPQYRSAHPVYRGAPAPGYGGPRYGHGCRHR